MVDRTTFYYFYQSMRSESTKNGRDSRASKTYHTTRYPSTTPTQEEHETPKWPQNNKQQRIIIHVDKSIPNHGAPLSQRSTLNSTRLSSLETSSAEDVVQRQEASAFPLHTHLRNLIPDTKPRHVQREILATLIDPAHMATE